MCKNCIIKEIVIYFIILIILAFTMHPDLLSEPIKRLDTMAEMGKYAHPFLYASIFYLVVYGIRKIINKILKKTISKKNN